MSVTVSDFELKINGKKSNHILARYRDDEGETFFRILEDGYYPFTKSNDYILIKDIIKIVATDFPKSEIFLRIADDYGEEAYSYKEGKFKKLKKRWV